MAASGWRKILFREAQSVICNLSFAKRRLSPLRRAICLPVSSLPRCLFRARREAQGRPLTLFASLLEIFFAFIRFLFASIRGYFLCVLRLFAAIQT